MTMDIHQSLDDAPPPESDSAPEMHEPTPVIATCDDVAEISETDSDAFNTTDARVHFGPLKSPEKKFLSSARGYTPRSGAVSSPVRRSARLSEAYTASPLRPGETSEGESESESDGENAEQEAQSRSGTPENDLTPDEPSSVLATRIIRAHDNPSPPPSAEVYPSPTTGTSLPALIDIPELAISPNMPLIKDNDHGEGEGHEERPSRPPPSALSLPAASSSLTAHAPPIAETLPEEELISFEPLMPLPGDLADDAHDDQVEANAVPDAPAAASSVDDLLSSSPMHSHAALLDLTSATQLINREAPTPPQPSEEGVTGPEDIAETESSDERAVADALIVLDTDNFAPSPSPAPPTETLNVVPDNEVPDSADPLHTPVWRSTRPRRSGTPYALRTPKTISPSANGSDQTISVIDLTTPNAQTRRKRKGKERALALDDPIPNDSPNRSGSPKELDNSVEATMERERDERRRRDRSGKASPGKVYRRELESLSPTSADVLSQLIPSIKVLSEQDLSNSAEPQEPSTPTTPRPQPFAFSVFPQRPEPSFVMHKAPVPEASGSYSSPVRFTTPVRFTAPSSPTRPQFTTLDDSNRTPARRIPINSAPKQIQMSAQKKSQLGNRVVAVSGVLGAGPSTQPPVFTIRPADSPARRVNIDSAASPAASTLTRPPASPLKHFPVMRSGSVEPRPLVRLSPERSRSAEPAFHRPAFGAGRGESRLNHLFPSSAPKSNKLPFPLVPSTSAAHPNSIPEENESEPMSKSTQATTKAKSTIPLPSPQKSSLKQPSSRIPRIGAKPYSRPLASKEIGAVRESKLPALTKKIDLLTIADVKPAKPFRMVVTASATSPSDTIATGVTATSSTALTKATAPASVGLKRKREAEKIVPDKRPVVAMRQVGSSVAPSASPIKPVKKASGPVPFRKVVDRIPAPQPQANKSVAKENVEEVEAPTKEQDSDEAEPPIAGSSRLTKRRLPHSSSPNAPTAPPESQSTSEQTAAQDPSRQRSPTLSDAPPNGVRRTTRARKPAQVNDVFGIAGPTPPSPPPPQPRRRVRPPISQSNYGPFSGLSAVALKALTASNTAKNQTYLSAKLETEVIRKQGDRPESPTIKVRTVSQRENDEKERQRKERAARRARRSGDMLPGDEEGSDTGNTSPAEGDADWDTSSDASPPRRHRRGPGDEEDYETPDKSHRPSKKIRLEDGEAVPTEDKRQVKWDRGLSSTIYLHEVHPRPRNRPKEEFNKKGCLIKTAKTLSLDTLGNLPDVDTPLPDIEPENIVVKKYVYDNDLETTAEPVAVAKSTRSKKKSKS